MVGAGGPGPDYEGNRYLDFSSQLVNTNIGHQHPKVIAAIQEQAATLATIAPQHANAARSEAARLICELAPDSLNKVFFTNGGADANENAIRMARLHTGRRKVLSFYRSYHGNTGSAIVATGDPRRWPDVIRFEGPGTIAAILIETVVGTAGVLIPPPGYLEGVRALCDQHGIILILDEVMAGFGRTGAWFAFDHFNARPDLVTFAKGSNSGYVPVGGVIISDEIAATFDTRVFPGGLTYSGHPLAAASIVASITAMREEGIVENAARIGSEVLGPGLAALAEKHPVIGEVRGLGVFWALDLVSNRETRAMLAPYGGTSEAMTVLGAEAKKRGLLPFMNFNRLHVVPPCTVTDDEARTGLAILDEVFSEVDRYYEG